MSLAERLNPAQRRHELKGEVYKEDGTMEFTISASYAFGKEDFDEFIRSRGQDPDEVTYSWGVTSNPSGGFWNKLLNVKPKTIDPKRLDTTELFEVIDRWAPEQQPPKRGFGTFVLCPADLQVGKTDYGLTSADMAKRVLASFDRAKSFVAGLNFEEIVIADLGDIVENFNSTSSQRGTNDLAITEQMRLARRLMLEGIKMLAPYAPKITYVSVPSNHGSVRVSMKSAENHAHDDYGLEVAEQLRDVVAHSDKLRNVHILTPDFPYESLSYETSGTTLGFVHGHQSNGPDGLGKWWAGQSHGRLPVAVADILLVGHFHSFRVQQSGDARWLMVSPSSDNGSSWFTNKTGESSQSGMLSFTTAGGRWDDLVIM